MNTNSEAVIPASSNPKSGFADLAAAIICFLITFFLPRFAITSFWDEPEAFGIGTGFGLFFSLLPVCPLTLFYVKKSAKGFSAKEITLILCQLAVLFSFLLNSSFIRTFFQLFLFVYITGLLCSLRSESLSIKEDTYHYLIPQLKQVISIPVRKVCLPLKSLAGNIRIRPNKKLSGIIIGCLLSLPVLLVVGSLLVSGDAAFGSVLSDIVGSFSLLIEKIYESLFFSEGSAGVIFFCSVNAILLSPFVFSVFFCFRHNIQKELSDKNFLSTTPRSFISPNIATGFYVMICLLYVLYLFSQLSYFFGAFSGRIPLAVNMTLSEYARRGFFEMSAIAVINLGLITFGVIFVKRNKDAKISPLFKGSFTFLRLFTPLLIITAISKMVLYITSMGLTNKRIIVCIADILLSVVIVCVVVRLYKPRFPYMKIILYVCLTVMSLYALVGDSALIAYFNTNAYIKGYHSELDIGEIYYETLPVHSVKNLRRIAEDNDDIFRLQAKYVIGEIVFYSSTSDTEDRLGMSIGENLIHSKDLSDFLFWEYAKDNKEFITYCLDYYLKTSC